MAQNKSLYFLTKFVIALLYPLDRGLLGAEPKKLNSLFSTTTTTIGGHRMQCSVCLDGEGEFFACVDGHPGIMCRWCSIAAHRDAPCHRIQVGLLLKSEKLVFVHALSYQVWSGAYFVPISLTIMGYVMYLGHRPREGEHDACPNRKEIYALNVIDVNGIFALPAR